MTIGNISPCLWYAGQALEAAEFYVSIFGGSIDKVHRAVVETPGCKEGDVLFVEFTLAGSSYQALNGGPFTEFTDAISLSISCEDQRDVDRVWDALISGGGRPVQCGWVKDKYGVSWQVVPQRLLELLGDTDRDRARRAMLAMMEMIKLDVAKLEEAAAGGG